MVDFAAHFTIHATKIIVPTFPWKMLSLKVVHQPIVCQSELDSTISI